MNIEETIQQLVAEFHPRVERPDPTGEEILKNRAAAEIGRKALYEDEVMQSLVKESKGIVDIGTDAVIDFDEKVTPQNIAEPSDIKLTFRK